MTLIFAANWKMNGNRQEALDWIEGMVVPQQATAILCAPSLVLGSEMVQAAAASKGIYLGGQDCHAAETGAYTGWQSAEMLSDIGAGYVIVGHSERRDMAGETNADVKAKAEAALAAGLRPIICLGEASAEDSDDVRRAFVAEQVRQSVPQTDKDLIIAYEPIWAIGTGLVPTTADIEAMHTLVMAELDGMGIKAPVLYGGSAKPSNAAEILALPQVGGLLVGGASLKADSFSAICAAG